MMARARTRTRPKMTVMAVAAACESSQNSSHAAKIIWSRHRTTPSPVDSAHARTINSRNSRCGAMLALTTRRCRLSALLQDADTRHTRLC
jgi:hypothetical protein